MSETSKPKFFKDPQNIIAVGVTIISLCALIVSLMQTRIMQEERELMREYSRASVWPRLEFNISKTNDEDGIEYLVLKLTNNGIGPAIITHAKVSYKDSIANNWTEYFSMQEIPDSLISYSNTGFSSRIVKIGETLEILELEDNPQLAQAFLERIKDLTIDIYYESIYGETWHYQIKKLQDETIEIEDFEGLPENEVFGN